MSMVVPVPGGQGPGPGWTPVRKAAAPSGPGFSVPAAPSALAVPAEPVAPPMPREVEVDISDAADRYEELQRQGRQLRFRVGEQGGVVVDVCDLSGTVLRTVPPEQALEIVGGAAVA